MRRWSYDQLFRPKTTKNIRIFYQLTRDLKINEREYENFAASACKGHLTFMQHFLPFQKKMYHVARHCSSPVKYLKRFLSSCYLIETNTTPIVSTLFFVVRWMNEKEKPEAWFSAFALVTSHHSQSRMFLFILAVNRDGVILIAFWQFICITASYWIKFFLSFSSVFFSFSCVRSFSWKFDK